MSAETLRRAARLMRSRAEAATPGPWEAAQGASGGWWIESPYTATVADIDIDSLCPEADAQHIVSWHPAVTLAVADWLEAEAESHRVDLVGPFPSGCCRMSQALAVARAYLGESA